MDDFSSYFVIHIIHTAPSTLHHALKQTKSYYFNPYKKKLKIIKKKNRKGIAANQISNLEIFNSLIIPFAWYGRFEITDMKLEIICNKFSAAMIPCNLSRFWVSSFLFCFAISELLRIAKWLKKRIISLNYTK